MGIKFKGSELLGKKPNVGDIGERELALNLTDGMVYSKTAAGVIVPLSGEVAGKAWSSTVTYEKGDIVVNQMVLPNMVFISLEDNNLNNQLPHSNITQHWQELDTIMYNVGLYTPVVGSEYPAFTGEKAGAVWYATGLGVDANGDPITYKFVTGNLAGVEVADGDRIAWVDGDATAVVWLHSPYPRVSGERGGVMWASGRPYSLGDVATENGDVYTSLTGTGTTPNLGNRPAVSKSDWKRTLDDETGGKIYDSSHQYVVGDVVSIGDKIYIIGENPAALGTPMVQGGNPASITDNTTYKPIGGAIIAQDVSVAVDGWTSGASIASVTETNDGVNPVSPSNPVKAGVNKQLQDILNIMDDFIDPGTY